jgi:aminoglycoside 3-N-acetyltransferase
MDVREIAVARMPQTAVKFIRRTRLRIKKALAPRLKPISENRMVQVLRDFLGISSGDVIFVHSSLDGLNLEFPPIHILTLLDDIVGSHGTIVFPTYPQLGSYEFLRQGLIFDVRKTPSFTGLLSELARRQPGALRSLHPTKSVCARGEIADMLTKDHQLSPYPHDKCSPYYKLIECKAKIIGIGISTARLSFVHCVEDAMKSGFPVRTYHPEKFSARCINYAGEAEIVPTYAHDLKQVRHNIPQYIRKHIPTAVARDLTIEGSPFFCCEAELLFKHMRALAEDGITIYPRKSAA